MRIICTDLEADNLLDDATKIWCASYTELDKNMNPIRSWTETDTYSPFFDPSVALVMHNGVTYDGALMEKITGKKIQCKIIDTLWLSWHMYPKRISHGLEGWGEELGIPKPPVDDWKNLKLEDYIHRCEEDVRIQTALWQQMWKHLNLLYDTEEGIWHLVDHLSFKATCIKLQERTKWKLNEVAANAFHERIAEEYEVCRNNLERVMPQQAKYKIRKPPAKRFKLDKTISATGEKWKNLVMKEVDPDLYGSEIKAVMWDEEIKVFDCFEPPKATSHVQIKNWLFDLGWVPDVFDRKRNKDTNEVRLIPKIKNDEGDLSASVEALVLQVVELKYLQEITILKHRLDVVNGFLRCVDDKGFIAARSQGLTNTLRLKHKEAVNLPSSRKLYGQELRSMLEARSLDYEICGADLVSVEDCTKHHYMMKHDPEYVADMLVEGYCGHLDIAVSAGLITEEDMIWYKAHTREDDPEKYDRIYLKRYGGKQTNYAATYGAQPETIAAAAGVALELGTQLFEGYWLRNWSIKAIADEQIVVNSRGMKWLWNPVAKIWYYLKAEKDRFSTLNQGTATYCFDRWLWYILQERPQLTAQFHDEGVWELKTGNREVMEGIIKGAIQKVNDELKLNRDLDCDVQFGENYGDVH